MYVVGFTQIIHQHVPVHNIPSWIKYHSDFPTLLVCSDRWSACLVNLWCSGNARLLCIVILFNYCSLEYSLTVKVSRRGGSLPHTLDLMQFLNIFGGRITGRIVTFMLLVRICMWICKLIVICLWELRITRVPAIREQNALFLIV
jgi:hypothetical protein